MEVVRNFVQYFASHERALVLDVAAAVIPSFDPNNPKPSEQEVRRIGDIFCIVGALTWEQDGEVLARMHEEHSRRLFDALLRIMDANLPLLGDFNLKGFSQPWVSLVYALESYRMAKRKAVPGGLRVDRTANVGQILLVGTIGERRFILLNFDNQEWDEFKLVGKDCSALTRGSTTIAGATVPVEDPLTAACVGFAEKVDASFEAKLRIDDVPLVIRHFRQPSRTLGVLTRYTVTVFVPKRVTVGAVLTYDGSRKGFVKWVSLDLIDWMRSRRPARLFPLLFDDRRVSAHIANAAATYNLADDSEGRKLILKKRIDVDDLFSHPSRPYLAEEDDL